MYKCINKYVNKLFINIKFINNNNNNNNNNIKELNI